MIDYLGFKIISHTENIFFMVRSENYMNMASHLAQSNRGFIQTGCHARLFSFSSMIPISQSPNKKIKKKKKTPKF